MLFLFKLLFLLALICSLSLGAYSCVSSVSQATAQANLSQKVVCDNGVKGVTSGGTAMDNYILITKPDGTKVWTNAVCIIEEL